MGEQDNEVFIDADSGFSNEKDSYETLIIKQMAECIKVLSREMTGGQVIHKSTSGGTEKYIEDVRELVINHVDTLRMLICTYIKNDNKKQLDKLMSEIEEYKNKLGEVEMIVPGKGNIKVKDIGGLNVDHPLWKKFIHFKAQRYRELFEILVSSYNDQRSYIRSLEEE